MRITSINSTILSAFEVVFLGDLFAVALVEFDQGAFAIADLFADPQRGAGACKRIENCVTGAGGHQDAAFDEFFVKLRGVPCAALLGVARDSCEVKDIPRHPAARISALVAVLLPPGWHPDVIGIELGALTHQPPKRPMIVSEIVVIVLTEREDLRASFAFPVR
jgi:hypothetical protein